MPSMVNHVLRKGSGINVSAGPWTAMTDMAAKQVTDGSWPHAGLHHSSNSDF